MFLISSIVSRSSGSSFLSLNSMDWDFSVSLFLKLVASLISKSYLLIFSLNNLENVVERELTLWDIFLSSFSMNCPMLLKVKRMI